MVSGDCDSFLGKSQCCLLPDVSQEKSNAHFKKFLSAFITGNLHRSNQHEAFFVRGFKQ